jgi:hypothetical protein
MENDNDEIKPDFVQDLYRNEWIVEKIKRSDVYAQNLYAAICNNELLRNDVFDILVDDRTSYSWRSIAGIVASIRNCGEDYLNFYCSGIIDEDIDGKNGFVPEQYVTEEIRTDLKKIGWLIVPYENEVW